MNREEHLAELNLEGLHTEPRPAITEEDWVCPRCRRVLEQTARGTTMILWECARCGYLKVTKHDKG